MLDNLCKEDVEERVRERIHRKEANDKNFSRAYAYDWIAESSSET